MNAVAAIVEGFRGKSNILSSYDGSDYIISRRHYCQAKKHFQKSECLLIIHFQEIYSQLNLCDFNVASNLMFKKQPPIYFIISQKYYQTLIQRHSASTWSSVWWACLLALKGLILISKLYYTGPRCKSAGALLLVKNWTSSNFYEAA